MKSSRASEINSLYFFLLLLFLFLLWTVSSSIAQQMSAPSDLDSGLVTVVYDGDTVRVQFSDGSSQRVRFIGVDTPELNDSRENIALWAHLAKRFSFYYLYRKKIHLTYDQTRLDQHGRTLAYVWIDKEGLFNEFIIREGFAFAFLAFPFQSDLQKRFKEAQQEARQRRKGFWKEGEPEVIASDAVRSHLGKCISVKFVCSQVSQKRSFIYLTSSGQEFEALIPQDRQALFPPARTYVGKELIVSGFLEEFEGWPQMMIFFPRQLRSAADRK